MIERVLIRRPATGVASREGPGVIPQAPRDESQRLRLTSTHWSDMTGRATSGSGTVRVPDQSSHEGMARAAPVGRRAPCALVPGQLAVASAAKLIGSAAFGYRGANSETSDRGLSTRSGVGPEDDGPSGPGYGHLDADFMDELLDLESSLVTSAPELRSPHARGDDLSQS